MSCDYCSIWDRDARQGPILRYVSLEKRIPADHPLPAIRPLIDEVLAGLSCRFDTLYARRGRPSIPPEPCCAPCRSSFSTPSVVSCYW